MADHIKNNNKWQMIRRLAICIAIPLGVGLLSSALTMDAMEKFGMMNQPPLAPPAWLFPVVWTLLYIAMGVASYLIWKKNAKNSKMALMIYGGQLFFNFCWSIVFFNFGWYWFALIWLLIMWGMIIALVKMSKDISRSAMWMLVPYLVWTTFAAYLNLGIAMLN